MTPDYHERRQQRLRREKLTFIGYLMLWSMLVLFLLACALALN